MFYVPIFGHKSITGSAINTNHGDDIPSSCPIYVGTIVSVHPHDTTDTSSLLSTSVHQGVTFGEFPLINTGISQLTKLFISDLERHTNSWFIYVWLQIHFLPEC